jgi:hypothetical protein
LNQDFQDFEDWSGRLWLEVMVICKGLLFTLLFADALRIGEKPGNESAIKY